MKLIQILFLKITKKYSKNLKRIKEWKIELCGVRLEYRGLKYNIIVSDCLCGPISENPIPHLTD